MTSSIADATRYWVHVAQVALGATENGAPTADRPFVWLGAPLGKFVAPVTLQVYGVTGIRRERVGSKYKIRETYKIRNLLTVFQPGMAFADRIDEVVSAFGTLDDLLVDNPTLGQTVDKARIVLSGTVDKSTSILLSPRVSARVGEVLLGADIGGKTLASLAFDIKVRSTTLVVPLRNESRAYSRAA